MIAHHRWCTLPLIVLGVVAHAFATAIHAFENTAIARAVELGGAVVHVTTTYAIKATFADARVYTFAISSREMQTISWLEVKVKGQQETLPVYERLADSSVRDNRYHLVDVTLSKPLAVNGTLNLVLETVHTHATFPWPKEAAQNDELSLKYQTELFVLSPYPTTVQRTKLRALLPRFISYTTPENVEAFTLSNPVTKSGATVTYGPYNNIPPSTNEEFLSTYQQQVTAHFYHGQPIVEVQRLLRTAGISHWGANLNIQDEIVLRNSGPTLKGRFSRKDYQEQAYYKRIPSHILPALTLYLPPGIRDVYYYDAIGNVTTSNLRVVPSTGKKSDANRYSVFDFKPRYPLLGGWNYSFTLGWDAPLGDSAVFDSSTGKYVVEVPIMTPINGAVINQAEIQIILPEGAVDIDFSTPYPPLASETSTHQTYLDSVGRPKLNFKYKNLTTLHAQKIYVSYKVPFSAHMRKPLVVGVALFSVFALAIIRRRVDFTILKEKEKNL